MKHQLKRALLWVVSRLTGRTAVLLGRHAAAQGGLLLVDTRYRIDGDALAFTLHPPTSGVLSLTLVTGAERAATLTLPCSPGDTIQVRLCDGEVSHGATSCGSLTDGQPLTARRLECALGFRTADGQQLTRRTGHYLPRTGEVNEAYYAGEDYVDYEEQSAGVHSDVVDVARRHAVTGAVLDIGCATGSTMAALRQLGLTVTGVDYSGWAVEQARARLGDVVYQADLERDGLPPSVRARGPFHLFVMSGVLEHFADPAAVLQLLTPLAAPGAVLLIITCNADSLSHKIFGRDWEGYFDWTHHGVDIVSASWLRSTLPGLGWEIAEFDTWHIWQGSSDPTQVALREWHAADARLRALLRERDLGDFVKVVARWAGSPGKQ